MLVDQLRPVSEKITFGERVTCLQIAAIMSALLAFALGRLMSLWSQQ